jgi:hypothetical protein
MSLVTHFTKIYNMVTNLLLKGGEREEARQTHDVTVTVSVLITYGTNSLHKYES